MRDACDTRGECESCWGAGPQGSPAGLERARRGRPCGAHSRVPLAGRGSAGRLRRITLSRRAAPLRPAVRRGVPVFGPGEVQVRGGRPPGEGARGEGGRAGTSAGERGSAAEKHPSSAARVRGGGLRPKRAPQRVGRLFGRALAARSAERFIGWLRKWGGGMGDAELGGRSAGLSGSGSGE